MENNMSDIGKVLFTYGDWVVTDFGVECTRVGYPISKERLNETDWIRHVCEKTWVVDQDFINAYNKAKIVHGV